MASELALPYVPIDPRIERHPKTRKFLRLLGLSDDPFAHMHVVKFLMEVGELHPDGSLGNIDPEDIADMARWRGDAKIFTDAMCDAGWLMFGEGGYVVVGWDDYGGQVYLKRVEFRDAKRDAANVRWHQEGKHNNQISDDCPLCRRNAPPPAPMQNDAQPMQNDAPAFSAYAKHAEGEGEGEPKGEPKPKEKKHSSGKPDLPVAGDAGLVIAHYLGRYPKRGKQAKAAAPKIKARLAEGYTAEQLCAAIDGNAASDFHVSGGHTQLELIVRNAVQVDRFLEKPAQNANAPPPRGYHAGSRPDEFVDGVVDLRRI